jgi:hypothetical protein
MIKQETLDFARRRQLQRRRVDSNPRPWRERAREVMELTHRTLLAQNAVANEVEGRSIEPRGKADRDLALRLPVGLVLLDPLVLVAREGAPEFPSLRAIQDVRGG